MNRQNIVAGDYKVANTEKFNAINSRNGESIFGEFNCAEPQFVEDALQAATIAFGTFKQINKDQKALFLKTIALELEAMAPELIAMASLESALPEGRITGELARTTTQLRLFASIVEEGSWVEAVIDTALPDRTPAPRPDLRRMLVALGPVVVFGASNFPLAFSVAGGDTASALAAGCPVIVKAHPAHPNTSALTGKAVLIAAEKTGMPKGVFSLLYDNGYAIGTLLVKHPLTKAVGFTGSLRGGMALHKLAQERLEPIPVFAEMGSINPVILFPEIVSKQYENLANKIAASVALGSGQFCTNPGLLLAVKGDGLNEFKECLKQEILPLASANMLTLGILNNFKKSSDEMLTIKGVQILVKSSDWNNIDDRKVAPIIAEVSASDFLKNPQLKEEVFGPYSLLVVSENEVQLKEVIAVLGGQLTTTIMALEEEVEAHASFISYLQDKTGRIIFNGVPTGVEVCAAMQHGGPFPATNNNFTSVGSAAIYRFVRPLAWQDWPDNLLPQELRRKNTYEISRIINNKSTID